MEAPQSGESHRVDSLSETWQWSGTAWVKVAAAATAGPSPVGELWIVGSIQTSWLNETQFRAALGLNSSEDHKWCLCDGRNVAGSKFQTITGLPNVPDLRGSYLRMAGQNGSTPDWDGGNLRDRQYWSTGMPHTPWKGSAELAGDHKHVQGFYATGAPEMYEYGHRATGRRGLTAANTGSSFPRDLPYTSRDGQHQHNLNINGGGDKETRPNSFSVNHFIKIN